VTGVFGASRRPRQYHAESTIATLQSNYDPSYDGTVGSTLVSREATPGPEFFAYRSMGHDGPHQAICSSLEQALVQALTDRRNWISWPLDITVNGRVVIDEPAISQAYTNWDTTRESVEKRAARLAQDFRLALETVTPAGVREQIATLAGRDRDAVHTGADLIWQQVLAAIAQGRCDDAAACSAAALETLNLRPVR
jgi:hypothetical protein